MSNSPLTIALAALAASSTLTHAAIIIGGDIQNGNFNSGTGDVATDQWFFSETPPWVNLGTGPQTAQATRVNPANLQLDGTRNAVLAENAGRVFGMDTGYTIRNGDVFGLEYHWIDAFNWNDASDQVEVSLFTTDTDVFGVRNVLVSDLSGTSTTNASYETVTRSTLYTATAADDGKTLYVVIDTIDGNAAANGFARLDNFELSVTSIPEPGTATLALFALTALSFLRRRNR